MRKRKAKSHLKERLITRGQQQVIWMMKSFGVRPKLETKVVRSEGAIGSGFGL